MENFRKIKVTDLNMLFHHYLYSRCDFLSYKLMFTKINTLESVLVFWGQKLTFCRKIFEKKGGGGREKKRKKERKRVSELLIHWLLCQYFIRSVTIHAVPQTRCSGSHRNAQSRLPRESIHEIFSTIKWSYCLEDTQPKFFYCFAESTYYLRGNICDLSAGPSEANPYGGLRKYMGRGADPYVCDQNDFFNM